MMSKLPLRYHLIIIPVIVITIAFGTIFAVGQQIYRSLSNDPQIQIAGDMANYLSSSNDPVAVMPKTDVDLENGQVWFLIIYNEKGEVVASNAKLNGQTPELPQGVLDHAKEKGRNIVTWEPAKGIRIASVVNSYNGGYVLAGRSLEETEERIMMLGKIILAGWILSLGTVILGFWLLLPNIKKLH